MDVKNLEQFIANLEYVKDWLDQDLEYHAWLDLNCKVDIDDLYEDYKRGTKAS